MVLTFVILAITIVLFVWGKIRPDLVALLSVLALFLTGIIDTSQALAGFSDSTVVMIAALFVVGAGLSETGVTAWLGKQLLGFASGSKARLLVVLMLGTALLSAFISNTGTVATLMPAVVAAAWSIGSVPSQFLMPLAVAANTGGLLTLTGTPPNIVVAETLESAGFAPFGYFEYALIGLPLLVTAIVYMRFLGQHLLPHRKTGDPPVDLNASLGEMAEAYFHSDNLFQLRVRAASAIVGQTLEQTRLGKEHGLSVLHIERLASANTQQPTRRRPVRETLGKLRQQGEASMLRPDTMIQTNDILLVKGSQKAVEQATVLFNLGVQPVDGVEREVAGTLLSREVGLAEVLITPRSEYRGQTVTKGQIAKKFSVQVLSVRRRDKLVDQQQVKLAFGDSLLVRGTWAAIGLLAEERRNFVVVGSPEAMSRQVAGLTWQAIVAIVALVGMIGLMVTGLVPTVMATLMAAMVMILGGCLSTARAYRAISWSSVILIAAMIPMSTALEITGGAEFLANGLVNTLGALHPLALMAGVFLLTTGFSQVINNTATAVLVAPIVLQAALSLGVSPYPLLMIVAVSASTAFLTPIGTTTNLMVMSPGSYRFNDYIKVGLPLVVLFLVISLALVPLIWPL